MKVIHVFPYEFRVSGGHSNAILAFMQAQKDAGFDVEGVSPRDPVNNVDRFRYGGLRVRYMEHGDLAEAVKNCFSEDKKSLVVFYQCDAVVKQCASMIRQSGNHYMVSSGGLLHYRGPLHFIKKFLFLNVVSHEFIYGASGFHFITERERKRARILLPFARVPFLLIPNVVEPDINTEETIVQTTEASCFTFVYLGRLDLKHKGLDLAIKAFSKVTRKYDCRLKMAGPDWKRGAERLQQLAGDLGCADKVDVLAPMYGERKWEFLCSGDAFLALSRWEAFGIGMVEAMRAGLPVLVSNRMNLSSQMKRAGVACITALRVRAVARTMQRMIVERKQNCAIAQRGRQWAKDQFSSAAVGAKFRAAVARIPMEAVTSENR